MELGAVGRQFEPCLSAGAFARRRSAVLLLRFLGSALSSLAWGAAETGSGTVPPTPNARFVHVAARKGRRPQQSELASLSRRRALMRAWQPEKRVSVEYS